MTLAISKEERKQAGVYIIRSTVSNDTYIGSASNMARRFSLHKFALGKNGYKHTKPKAFKQYLKQHRLSTLHMQLIEVITDKDQRRARELELIQQLKPSLNCRTTY